jgi:hypothetical protein
MARIRIEAKRHIFRRFRSLLKSVLSNNPKINDRVIVEKENGKK